MRVYLKGVAITLGVLLVLLLIHRQFSHSGSDGQPGRKGRSRQDDVPVKRSSTSTKGRLSQTKAQELGTKQRAPSQQEADEIRENARAKAGTRNRRLPKSENVEDFSVQDEQNILEVDPVAATEPQVIRQWEELEEKRKKAKSTLDHLQLAKNPQDVKTDGNENDAPYPEWYSTSVVRSVTHGQSENFVGDQPLFASCPNADNDVKKGKLFGYVEPPEYISNSKNPCWWEDPVGKRQLRCLPYFYVAGVAKCGTTDLYRRLRYHPKIMWGTLKEYHWWDRLRYGASMELKFTKDSKKNDSPLPLREYARIIMGDDIGPLSKTLAAGSPSDMIAGDGSPSYLWDHSQWISFEGNQGCTEPRIIVGSFIKHVYPQVKIFLIFRHPTTRLYSRFLSRIPRVPAFKNASPAMFHDYVVKAVNMYKECFKRHSIRECAYNATLMDDVVIRLPEGLFSVYLEDWLRIFSREQMMIFRSEDYGEDVEGHIKRAFKFLGVDELNATALAPIVDHITVNVGQNYETVGSMLPITIQILNEFYWPFIKRLAELLQDRKFLWKDIVVT